MDSNLRREIILENYQYPINKGLCEEDGYIKVNSRSESCIDNLDFMMKIDDNIIKDIRFDGEACCISTAATSIMIKILIGKSIDDAKKILDNYLKMIHEEEYDEELLEELVVFDEIGKQPNRVNCALLPEKAIVEMIEKLQ